MLKKNKQWRQDCDVWRLTFFSTIMKLLGKFKNKVINLNLYNGIVDIRDLSNVVNPSQIEASYVPDNLPHHPTLVP
jgi:hypothetical protein